MDSNLSFRIIPCLDVKDSQVVKGINFVGLKEVGSPVSIAKKYNDEGADELVFLDITASNEKRSTMVDIVKSVSKEVFIPFTVGGGIRNLDDIYNLLDAGCDKVSINSSAIKNPSLINEGAKRFGSQCIVVAIDVKRIGEKPLDTIQTIKDFAQSINNYNTTNSIYQKDSRWSVYINGGRIDTRIDYLNWLKEVEDRGAGEIMLTSMDSDGMKNGYDRELLEITSSNVKIPLIASGGAGNMEHIKEAYQSGADAALAASIFHYNEISIMDLKQYLRDNNIPVRI